MENVMMDLMYTIPSDETITECTISRKMVEEKEYIDSIDERKEERLLESKSA